MDLQAAKPQPRVHADDCLLSSQELALLLGVSPDWLSRDRWLGPSIPFVKVGKQVRYKRADLLDHIAKQRIGAEDAP